MANILTNEDVLKLANLARINISESEVDGYIVQLNQIIEYVNLLESVDVSELSPTNQVTGLSNVWREDEIIDYGYDIKNILANVPSTQGDYMKVKRMIE